MHNKKQGFTLIELMVVVCLIAIASAIVSLAIPNQDQTRLERESQRLAILLEAARTESRATGGAVYWNSTKEGFEFLGLPKTSDIPTKWLNPEEPVQINGMYSDGKPVKLIVLGPEPIIPAQTIQLSLGKYTASIKTDGLAAFDSEISNQE